MKSEISEWLKKNTGWLIIVSMHVTRCIKRNLSYMWNTTFRGAFVGNVRSVSCWLHSAHTVLNGRKGFVVTTALRRLRRQLWGEEVDICVQQSTINTTIPVCLFVCPCCPAVIYWAPSPPAGSAMSGLDSLIGAEERIINSKPKISDNVVRASSSLSFCLCLKAIRFSNLLNTRTKSSIVKAKTVKYCILQRSLQFNFITTTSGWVNCADDWK